MGRTTFGRAAVLALAVLTAFAAAPTAAAAQVADTGSITGTITRDGGGAVTVNLFTTAGAGAGQVVSDDAGRYAFPAVAPGAYKLQFGHGERYQWAYRQLGFSQAATIQVTAGATAVVDDTMLQPGVVEIVATDAETGEPVAAVCAGRYEGFGSDCGTGGVLRLTTLPDGGYPLYITSPDGLFARTQVQAVVAFGKVTRIEVKVRPTTAIRATVVDRSTGAPVPGVCVAALPLVFGGVDGDTCDSFRNHTDDDGQIVLGELEPGEYTLLAVPERLPYGIQWVGRNGGVGSQYKAQRFQGEARRVTTVGPIRLDPPATISGTISDAATGEPMLYACASVLPGKGLGDPPLGSSCTQWETEGRYSIDTLGPYDWPVRFSPYQTTHAAVWSGGVTDRKAATLVRAGSAVLDGKLSETGEGLRLRVVEPDGEPYAGWFHAAAYNARTGDFVGEFDRSYRTLTGVAEQAVRIEYYADGFGRGWHGGTTFATANNARVRPGAPATVKVSLLPAG
jgi:hypothetical protein